MSEQVLKGKGKNGVKRADHYLTQSPAVSKGLGVVDLHVAGGRHIVHCHAVKIAAESSEKALRSKGRRSAYQT